MPPAKDDATSEKDVVESSASEVSEESAKGNGGRKAFPGTAGKRDDQERGSSLLVIEMKDDLLPGIVRHYVMPERLSTSGDVRFNRSRPEKSKMRWKSKLKGAVKLHIANGHVYVAKRIKGYK